MRLLFLLLLGPLLACKPTVEQTPTAESLASPPVPREPTATQIVGFGVPPIAPDESGYLFPPTLSGDSLSRVTVGFATIILQRNSQGQFTGDLLPWPEAHRAGKDLLQQHANDPRLPRWEQQHAFQMFSQYLLSEPVTDSLLAVTAFYLELLRKNRNPSLKLTYEALRRLEDYWPPEKIRATARATLEDEALHRRIFKEQLDPESFTHQMQQSPGWGDHDTFRPLLEQLANP